MHDSRSARNFFMGVTDLESFWLWRGKNVCVREPKTHPFTLRHTVSFPWLLGARLRLAVSHTHKSIHAHTLLIHTFLPCSNAYTGHGAHLLLGCGWRSVVVNRTGVLTWTPPAAGGGGNAAFRWPLCDPACRTHAPRRSRHSWLPRAGNTNQRILDLSVRENKMVRVMLYHELFTCSFIFIVIFEPTCRLNIDIHSI